MKIFKYYSNNIRIKEIEDFRDKYDLRPLIFATNNQIEDLYLSFNNEKEILNKNNTFIINKNIGISYFIDNNKRFFNIEYGYQLCFKYNLFSIKYSIGSINLSTKKPNIIFNDNISINFKNFGFQLTHYSDWFLSNIDGYDVPYNLVIPLNFL